jgi:hypothetical protein
MRHESGQDTPTTYDIGRTERAHPAALLGCVLACAAAGLNLESEGGGKQVGWGLTAVGLGLRVTAVT